MNERCFELTSWGFTPRIEGERTKKEDLRSTLRGHSSLPSQGLEVDGRLLLEVLEAGGEEVFVWHDGFGLATGGIGVGSHDRYVVFLLGGIERS